MKNRMDGIDKVTGGTWEVKHPDDYEGLALERERLIAKARLLKKMRNPGLSFDEIARESNREMEEYIVKAGRR